MAAVHSVMMGEPGSFLRPLSTSSPLLLPSFLRARPPERRPRRWAARSSPLLRSSSSDSVSLPRLFRVLEQVRVRAVLRTRFQNGRGTDRKLRAVE